MHGRKMLAEGAALVAVAVLAATASAATAWQSDRSCGTPRDGGLTKNLRWETSGPWHVQMSLATARRIAKQVGPYEFQPSDSHPAPGDVPCDIAASVALAAANRWSIRSPARFAIAQGWTGYAVGPKYAFSCIATRRSPALAAIRCVHRADRSAGAIAVRLVVARRA